MQDWIDRLDKKLSKLKYSEKAQEKYPALTECATLDLGIIAIWFHDLDNYKSFRPKFVEILKVSRHPTDLSKAKDIIVYYFLIMPRF